MGSGGTQWGSQDSISVARMNQKTVYISDSAPATTYAGMLWYDSTNNVLYERNGADTAWLPSIEEWFTITEIASDTLQQSNDDLTETNNTSYTKLKEITCNVALANVRVKFALASEHTGVTVYGKVYKDGVAIGTERSRNTTSYATFSEDFATVAVGSKLQIYGKTSNEPWFMYCKNFRLYFTILRTYAPFSNSLT